jgi:glycopeptide antibiotics resistance protein
MFFREKKNYTKFVYTVLLILYLLLLLQMTLIGRTHTDPLSAVFTGWLPFKNYNATWNIDAVYNIFLLTPIIFLINGIHPFILQKNWKCKMAMLAFLISFFIEINQLIFSIGTFQIADLVYNTLSGIIGGELFILGYKLR